MNISSIKYIESPIITSYAPTEKTVMLIKILALTIFSLIAYLAVSAIKHYCKLKQNSPENQKTTKSANILLKNENLDENKKNNFQKDNIESSHDFRKRIYENTKNAILNGYRITNVDVLIDPPSSAESYEDIEPIKKKGQYQTKFIVHSKDTINAALDLKEKGVDPCAINMANRFVEGGGVEDGCPAQEEALCRRTNLISALKTQKYPFPKTGGIYAPGVSVFREEGNGESGYGFMEKVEKLSFISVAAYDLRGKSSQIESLENDKDYMKDTRDIIKNMLRMLINKGHTHIVLGALGCGAFENPPILMAKIFKEIFQEDEFKGQFEEVIFAILQQYNKDKANVDAFSEISNELSIH